MSLLDQPHASSLSYPDSTKHSRMTRHSRRSHSTELTHRAHPDSTRHSRITHPDSAERPRMTRQRPLNRVNTLSSSNPDSTKHARMTRQYRRSHSTELTHRGHPDRTKHSRTTPWRTLLLNRLNESHAKPDSAKRPRLTSRQDHTIPALRPLGAPT